MLDDKEIDVIYIPLPTFYKTEWAIKAAKAKKHILLEKPLPGIESDKDIMEIVKACKDNQVEFMDGVHLYFIIGNKIFFDISYFVIIINLIYFYSDDVASFN